jgi:hypothetical protein
MGVIRQQKLSGSQSYPAVLTKRLQRRINKKPVERFRLWSAGLRQTDRLTCRRQTNGPNENCELSQAVRILNFTGKEGGWRSCCTVRISTRTTNKFPFFYCFPQFLQADVSIVSRIIR